MDPRADRSVVVLAAAASASESLRDLSTGAYPGKVTLCLSGTRHAVHKNTEAGWRSVAGGGLEVRVIPGDHYTVLAQDAHLLAETIRSLYRESLEMAQGECQ